MPEFETCIEVRDLSKHYGWGKVKALRSVNLEIKTGEVFGLIGPNGAGKTTLMSCMLGLVRPNSGQVMINGAQPTDLVIRKQTGFLPERPNFDAWMNVGQFLAYHHALAAQPEPDPRESIRKALERVGLEPTMSKQRIRKLSRGLLQRLGLAQVLLGKPTICFLDEPASGMDPLGVQLVRELLLEWKAAGTTVILNSHHLAEVEKTCDRIAFINGGTIRAIEPIRNDRNHIPYLLVRWKDNLESNHMASELVRDVATTLNTECETVDEHSARLRLAQDVESHQVISALVRQGVLLQEAVLERSSLEDLFKRFATPNTEGKKQ